MHDRLEAWNDHSAICVIAVGSHGDPLDLAAHEVRAFVEKLEGCLLAEAQSKDQPSIAHDLHESWAITLRHLAACRYYLPEVLTSPQGLQAERAWSKYLHQNELGLALDEAEIMGRAHNAPAEYWRELRFAAENMGLTAMAAKFSTASAA
jgi:hypothetical protein